MLVMLTCLAVPGPAGGRFQEAIAPHEPVEAVVIFRYDDVGACPERGGSLKTDEAVFAAFAEYGLPLVAGVIPFCGGVEQSDGLAGEGIVQDRAIFEWLLRRCETQRIEIAQHGVTHKAVTSGVHSEFRGLPVDVQGQRILAGKRHLEELFGRSVRTFIPPWNSYDNNTLEALRLLGFECISDDWRDGGFGGSLSCIPQTATLGQFQDILDRYAMVPPGSLITVLIHGYDFREDGVGARANCLDELRALLVAVASRKDVRCMTMAEFAGFWRLRYTRERQRAAERHVAWATFLRGLPGFTTSVRGGRPGVLLTESEYARANAWVGLVIGCAVLGPPLLAGLVGYVAGRVSAVVGSPSRRRQMERLCFGAGLLVCTILVVRFARDRSIGVRDVCAFGLALGVVTGWRLGGGSQGARVFGAETPG